LAFHLPSADRLIGPPLVVPPKRRVLSKSMVAAVARAQALKPPSDLRH